MGRPQGRPDILSGYGMNIVIAPDSFKGSLTALEAADAIEQGSRCRPRHGTAIIPLADGGGTTEALVVAARCRMVRKTVTSRWGTGQSCLRRVRR
jgi:glycerate kinase